MSASATTKRRAPVPPLSDPESSLVVDTQVLAWVHARVQTFTQRALMLAGFSPLRRPRILSPGPGRANYILATATARGAVIVKIRVDADDDAAREAWALRAAPRSTAPLFLALLKPSVLRKQAPAEAQRDLDVALGGVLVMRALEPARTPKKRHPLGERTLGPGADANVMTAIARVLADLHRGGRQRSRGPVLPSSVVAIGQEVEHFLEVLARSVQVSASLQQDLRRAWQRLDTGWRKIEKVHTFCHGDLRWHNFFHAHPAATGEPQLCLLDFEAAGIGDPALDLALFTERSGLSEHQELALLDATLEYRARDRSLMSRYFGFKPVARVLGAMAGLVDLVRVASAVRPIVGGVPSYLEQRSEETAVLIESVVRRAVVRRAVVRLAKGARRAPTSVRPVLRTRSSLRPPPSVAIDGTASSGKSVLACAVATHLRLPHFNTGTLYRYAALLAQENTWDPDQPAHHEALLMAIIKSDLRLSQDGALYAGRHRFEASLLSVAIEETVALWAQHPDLRAALGAVIGEVLGQPAVVEGRDVATVLFSRADRHWFVDAAVPVRAQRLQARLGAACGTAQAQRLIKERDEADRRRAQAPLFPSSAAEFFDTSRMTKEQSLQEALWRLEAGRAQSKKAATGLRARWAKGALA